MADTTRPLSTSTMKNEPGFVRALGLFDGTMIVVGSMIGSGIFIVAADITRQTGSPAGLLLTWILTGLLTISAALSYGELAALFPHAGGQYVYLREAYSPLWGFLYGWTLFLVIQTGTIGAVALHFAHGLDDSATCAFFEVRHKPVRAATRGDIDDCVSHVPEYVGRAPWQAHPKHFHERQDAFAAGPDLCLRFYWPQCSGHLR